MTAFSRLLAALAVLALAGLGAWCFPTLYSDTGLVQVPTADVMLDGHYEIGIHSTEVDGPRGSATAYVGSIVYGLGGDIEIGAVASRALGSSGNGFDTVGAAVKMTLTPEAQATRRLGLAAGARFYKHEFGTTGGEDIEVLEAYTVVSMTLMNRMDINNKGSLFRLHGGVGYASYDGGIKGAGIAPFLGVQYTNTSGSGFVADYMSELKDGDVTLRKAVVSAAIRRELNPKWVVELGMTKPFGAGEDNQMYLGFAYRIPPSMPLPPSYPR